MDGHHQLNRSRANALRRLESDPRLSELRDAAADLGTTLVKAADDEDLWTRLADGSARAQTLNDKQRLAVRTAVDVDWVPLLNEVGYQPPPPAEAYATELVDAIETALESRDPTDVEAARERVRALGLALVDVSEQTQASRSSLRRWLRRGVRVAGKVLVVVGVAAAGAALTSAVPGLALLSPLLMQIVVDVLKDGTVRVLESALDRVLPAHGEDSDADDTSDRDVLEFVYSIRHGELGRLLPGWDVASAEEARSLAPIEETDRLVEHAVRALYRAWDAAIGAPWYTGGFADRFDLLSNNLGQLRHLLSADTLSPSAIAASLRSLDRDLALLKERLGRVVPDPHR